jgi:nucleoside-diphosphate-sugar epimerase
MKKAIVLGAGGFIGSHLVRRLKSEGFWVRGVDLKYPEFTPTAADEFIIGDLRDKTVVGDVIGHKADEVYQLAAEMGGAGFLFTGDNDADVMHHSALINLHVLDQAVKSRIKKIFYASSACIYPKYNQADPGRPLCAESSAYPADPDSEYGWEKLFSERLYLAYSRNYQIDVRIARFHNVYGPEGAWRGGREKAPAAICRKVAAAAPGDRIEIWGDGRQTRSFLFIEDCLQGIRALMDSRFQGPVNIGSEEMTSIADFAAMIIRVSGKPLFVEQTPGPQGVRGRNSDNRLVYDKTGWMPRFSLEHGIRITYDWVAEQVSQTQATKWKKLVLSA